MDPTGNELLEHLLQMLEDYGYCKVTYCKNCHYWGLFTERMENIYPDRRCRKHHACFKHFDDYCSEALEIKEQRNE